MARLAVLGFTEAELGFVLAALFIAVSGFQIADAARAREEAGGAGDALEAARDSLVMARTEADSLRRLTSRLTPYCSERGETSDVIARVMVEGAGAYRLDGAPATMATIEDRLDAWLEISRRKRCRFEIVVVPGPGLSAAEFMRARVPLGRLFYFR